MLIRFKLENFRSFRSKQELSLVASSLKDHANAVRQNVFSEGMLCVAAIYGANASGKTNVLLALSFFRDAILNSHRQWSPEQDVPLDPFLLDSTSTQEPSSFEIDLLVGGTRYTYGFSATRREIKSEYLHAFPNGRKQLWFERRSKHFSFGKHLLGENRAIENLTRQNSLFLSAAAQNNHEQLTPFYRWFSDKCVTVPSNRAFLRLTAGEMCKTPGRREQIVALLGSADLGIVGIDVKDEPFDSNFRSLMQAMTKALRDDLAKGEFKGDLATPPESFLKTSLRHKSAGSQEGVSFDLDRESAGTVAWFGLLAPILLALDSGSTLTIDELDASLHPLLSQELVRVFNDPEVNTTNAQLIFNTHDTNLLDPDLLRRDQIWLVEKDPHGESHLYPLTDFKPRKHENFGRGYLQGRYGAVPFLGLQEALVGEDR